MFGEGKVAVVTGIGPAMGRSIAIGFADRGVDVVLAARNAERLDAVASEITARGGNALAVPTDITDQKACASLIDAAVDRFGGVDVLVQNGHHEGDWVPVLAADAESWKNIFDVNFYGALHLVQAAVPVMQRRGGGAVVLVNSGAALRNPKTMGAYSASKAALASLTRTLALEVGPSNVRVNGVYLGPVTGENTERHGRNAAEAMGISFEDWTQLKAAELPLGHIPTPDECAGAVLFLASDMATPITGQHLSVNGGQWIT